jgi:hypothetical protein
MDLMHGVVVRWLAAPEGEPSCGKELAEDKKQLRKNTVANKEKSTIRCRRR